MTPWTVTHKAPLSMGFLRQDYWSGLPLPSPGDLLDPRIQPKSPALQADSLPTELWGKSLSTRMGWWDSLNASLWLDGLFTAQETLLCFFPNSEMLSSTWRLWRKFPVCLQAPQISETKSIYAIKMFPFFGCVIEQTNAWALGVNI